MIEGLLELRDLADAVRASRSGQCRTERDEATSNLAGERVSAINGNSVTFTPAGFGERSETDLKLVAEEYGLAVASRIDAKTTHVLLPCSQKDLCLLNMPEVMAHDPLPEATALGLPVVTVDFVFELVRAVQRWREVCGSNKYDVVGDVGGGVGGKAPGGLGFLSLERVSQDVQVAGRMTEQCSTGVGSLKVFGNEFYGAPSLGDGKASTWVEVDVHGAVVREERVVEEEIEDTDKEDVGDVSDASDVSDVSDASDVREIGKVWSNDENSDGNVGRGGPSRYGSDCSSLPCTTPGGDACEVDDLRNFAAISSVTPLDMRVQDVYDNFGTEEEAEEEREEMLVASVVHFRALALEDDDDGDKERVRSSPTTSVSRSSAMLDADDIFPGDLLVRAPRNNKVRQRHAVPAGRHMVSYTESMTLRPRGRDIVEIDIKTAKNVGIECEGRIIKPLFFYKVRGEGWRVEYRRLLTVRDVPAERLGLPIDLDPAELFLSTAVEGCSVESLANARKVFVDRLSGGTRRAGHLEMERVEDGGPAWFWRHEFDAESGNVLYRN